MKTLVFGFIDLLFNLLLGVTVLFITSFMLITPSTEGVIDPPAVMLIELEWPNESKYDLDLWVRGPDMNWVGYKNKEAGYFFLDRDDLGQKNDYVIVNDERVPLNLNREVVTFNVLPPGEYFINIHHFSHTGDGDGLVTANIRVTHLDPYNVVFEGKRELTHREEITMLSFVIDNDGNVTDARDDVDMPYVNQNGTTALPEARDDEW